MKNVNIKEMTKKERRNYLLHRIQNQINWVIWNILEEENDDLKRNIRELKKMVRIYDNIIDINYGEKYNSPRIKFNLIFGDYEE